MEDVDRIPALTNVKYLKFIRILRYSKAKYERSFSINASYFFPQNPVIDTAKGAQHRYGCAQLFNFQ